MEKITSSAEEVVLQARDYQIEMLHDSLEGNIVVAMDTGSGKTQVAILRIVAELEQRNPDKIVWVLCPTIALAQQQHKVISQQLLAFQAKVLSGNDGVDRWGEKSIWDDVLRDINIVVSTHQVLLDALIHGFVRMDQISLLVFDEAHHCISKHPANRIMHDWYHQARGVSVPSILGLTASPLINNKVEGLKHDYRTEPERYNQNTKNKPRTVTQEDIEVSKALLELHGLYLSLNIEDDPYVVRLRTMNDPTSQKKLQKLLMSRKTYCLEQMKGFYRMAERIYKELGPWVTDHYIMSCTEKFRNRQFSGTVNFDCLDNDEKLYLSKVFTQIRLPTLDLSTLANDNVSTKKLHKLLAILEKEWSPDFSGLLFVETRAAVGLLAHLLTIHPRMKEKYSVGTFVGTSSYDKRKTNIGELIELHEQSETLNDLRSGKKNIIITTSVLEEGIDVSACNIVICFQKPPNLKAFIQRRGRARQSMSKYIIMFEDGDDDGIDTWYQLEEDMKLVYMDHTRQLEELEKREAEEEGGKTFLINSTGAKLTLDDAVQHLHHFCNTLPTTQYAERKPIFLFEESPTSGEFRAKVILPNSVDIAVREGQGQMWWKTQRHAKQEAALEAYMGLYRAGLVNDNLLPIPQGEVYVAIDKRSSTVYAREQFNPWYPIASAWGLGLSRHQYRVNIRGTDLELVPLILVLPCMLSSIANFQLFVNSETILEVCLEHLEQEHFDDKDVPILNETSKTILRSMYENRMKTDDSEFMILVGPKGSQESRRLWLQDVVGSCHPRTLLTRDADKEKLGLVKDLTHYHKRHLLQAIEFQWPERVERITSDHANCAEKSMYLKVSKWPKRADFLHPISGGEQTPAKSGITYIPADSCEIDKIPLSYIKHAMFLPSLIHRIEVSLIVEHLCKTLLGSINFENLDLVREAISSSVAREDENYQRLEFLGDTNLKLFTTINLLAKHLNWHEGFLSNKKDQLVSNSRLARAAQQTGLDKYILTRPFTGMKWRPLYVEDYCEQALDSTREISTKTLGDVVESIIGAASIDGGPLKVRKCLSVFLKEIDWLPLKDLSTILLDHVAQARWFPLPPGLKVLEHTIGHTFRAPSLLVEALTHASHIGPDATPSYERLEFLGDSILDFIVTDKIYHHKSKDCLEVKDMHRIRTALVNADFLAFLCMRFHVRLDSAEVVEDSSTGLFSTVSTSISKPLYAYMRHASAPLAIAQEKSSDRFNEFGCMLESDLAHGSCYPWAYLVSLMAEKYYSDLIESMLGAIYVDSGGSFSACEAFLNALGLLRYLERVLTESIHVMHPKEELGIAVGNAKLQYEVSFCEEIGTRGWNCAVIVGGKKICELEGGRGRFEIETKAAAEAVRVLKSNQSNRA